MENFYKKKEAKIIKIRPNLLKIRPNKPRRRYFTKTQLILGILGVIAPLLSLAYAIYTNHDENKRILNETTIKITLTSDNEPIGLTLITLEDYSSHERIDTSTTDDQGYVIFNNIKKGKYMYTFKYKDSTFRCYINASIEENFNISKKIEPKNNTILKSSNNNSSYKLSPNNIYPHVNHGSSKGVTVSIENHSSDKKSDELTNSHTLDNTYLKNPYEQQIKKSQLNVSTNTAKSKQDSIAKELLDNSKHYSSSTYYDEPIIISYDSHYDVYKTYSEGFGGVLFYTNCKDCDWSIYYSEDAGSQDDNKFELINTVDAEEPKSIPIGALFLKTSSKKIAFKIKNKAGVIFQYYTVMVIPGKTKLIDIEKKP